MSLRITIYAVSPFIPRVKSCFSCYKIGHIRKYCNGSPRCRLCGKNSPYEDGVICERQNLPPINCEGNHLSSTSSICPLFIRQKNIHVLASAENISLNEARKRIFRVPDSIDPQDTLDYNIAQHMDYRSFFTLSPKDFSNPTFSPFSLITDFLY